MPWRECNRMDERLRFVARLLDGEKMAVVCRDFGISRKTGYKLFNRYKEHGLRGLEDRARSPYRHPNKLPLQLEKAIVRIKQQPPSWGAPKIRDKLIKAYPVIRPPATSSTRCSIVMAWSSGVNAVVTRLREQRSVMPGVRMRAGVLTTTSAPCLVASMWRS